MIATLATLHLNCEFCLEPFEATDYRTKFCPAHRARESKAGDGFVLWEGPSQIDGSPIGVVVTHLRSRTMNRKLGDMSQAWILPRDVEPNQAARTGEDRAVCGSCRFRPDLDGGCYVPIASTAQRVWYTWRVRGSYVQRGLPAGELSHKPCRIGAWGDPGAVPVEAWKPLLEAVPGWTAYTHRWLDLDPRDWGWCMASVDNVEQQRLAEAMGWRTFRARAPDQPLLVGERVCPAAKEAPTYGRPNAVCATCHLCDGIRPKGNPPNVAIVVHGQATVKATAVVGGTIVREPMPRRPNGDNPRVLDMTETSIAKVVEVLAEQPLGTKDVAVKAGWSGRWTRLVLRAAVARGRVLVRTIGARNKIEWSSAS
jgi:hypothetical protein